MSARKQENFYRRDPMKALHGMVGLSMDEKATYNTMLDLLYASWKPLRDDDKADRLFIANWVGCAPQKLNPIISRLIERGRIIRIEIDGKFFLSDDAFEKERAKVKGIKVSEKSGEVSTNSEEVEQNSEEVETNPPLLDDESEQKQADTSLEKKREDKIRQEISLSEARELFTEIWKEAGEAVGDIGTSAGLANQSALLSLLATDPPCLKSEIINGVRSAAAWYLGKHGQRSMKNWDLAVKKAIEIRDERLRPKPVGEPPPPQRRGYGPAEGEIKAALRKALG